MVRLHLQPYGNLSGNSGVVAFASLPATIVVQFRGGDLYEYSTEITGAAEVDTMKRLAHAGLGLSTFIAQHRPHYARKLP